MYILIYTVTCIYWYVYILIHVYDFIIDPNFNLTQACTIDNNWQSLSNQNSLFIRILQWMHILIESIVVYVRVHAIIFKSFYLSTWKYGSWASQHWLTLFLPWRSIITAGLFKFYHEWLTPWYRVRGFTCGAVGPLWWCRVRGSSWSTLHGDAEYATSHVEQLVNSGDAEYAASHVEQSGDFLLLLSQMLWQYLFRTAWFVCYQIIGNT